MPEREIGGIKYTLTIKNVKNLNMRIKREGIFVSMPPNVPMRYADAFVYKNRDRIEQYMERYKEPENEQLEITVKTTREEAIGMVYRYVEMMKEDKIPQPDEIRFKAMKTMWGNCYTNRGIITLNTELLDMPREYLEYEFLCPALHGLSQR